MFILSKLIAVLCVGARVGPMFYEAKYSKLTLLVIQRRR